MVAFSEPEWQLARYIEVMRTGFAEVKFTELANKKDGRVWRSVPNRKWYAVNVGVHRAAARWCFSIVALK